MAPGAHEGGDTKPDDAMRLKIENVLIDPFPAAEERKRAQVRVHERWVRAVRRGMAAFGQPWTDLRGDRSDYDVLENIPALEAPVPGSDSDSDD